ncbi:flavodoxin [Shewanella sp. JM162201]|uniref:Flavodoxin n=1 Tax=Shewanella jiangmenensis TaxID=2837387 RepID=A0ABS5V2T0_9GAMM|nr:flavodoxin [Shewanella jiangmenensis]MBT1444756.1 flavodoxin [Shewanella jiangmenensis]
MKTVDLVFGTVYGSAQFVAETLSDELKGLGYAPRLWQPHELSGFTPCNGGLLIVVSSTTGSGDLPEDIQPWYYRLSSAGLYLPSLHFSVVGLGDSSYSDFCGAGEKLQALLTELAAKPVLPLFRIDAMETMEPETEAKTWLMQWHQRIESGLVA